MPHPRKFENLLDIDCVDVAAPDYVWLVYAACALSHDACGWGGWMIEAAFQNGDGGHPTTTGDALLPAQDQQICPRCRRATFRTGASIRLVQSEDQRPQLVSVVEDEVVALLE